MVKRPCMWFIDANLEDSWRYLLGFDDISTTHGLVSGNASRYSGSIPRPPVRRVRGNPVRVRNCPAAVSRYESPR